MNCEAPFKKRFQANLRARIKSYEYNKRFQHPTKEGLDRIERRLRELRGLLE